MESQNELTERKEPSRRGKPQSSLRAALIACGEAEDELTGKSNAIEFAEVCWARAIAGNHEWATFIRDTMCGKPAAAIQIDAGGADDGPMSVTLVQFGGGIVAKLPVSEAAPREEPIDVTPPRETPDSDQEMLGDLA